MCIVCAIIHVCDFIILQSRYDNGDSRRISNNYSLTFYTVQFNLSFSSTF